MRTPHYTSSNPYPYRKREPEATTLTGCKRLYPPLPIQFQSSYKKPRLNPKFPREASNPPRRKFPIRADETGLLGEAPKLFPQATSLPQGWLLCSRNGEAIDRIIPSKTPLSEGFDNVVESERRYPVPTEVMVGTEKVEIGVVIDLTRSEYYQPLDCTKKGIQHVKIPCGEKDSVPDGESVNRFVFEVLRLEGQKKYALVHCTDGYNDTGYMIVHYLMRSRCFSTSVTEALQIFAKARSPGIFKQNYIDALYKFYNETKPTTVVCPTTPEWKRRPQFLDLNAEPTEEKEEDEEEDNVSTITVTDEIDRVMKNDDVLGDAIPIEQQNVLRKACYGLLKIDNEAKRNSLFPGPFPVSLTRNNFELVRKRHFYTTWSAVGTRYMMLLTWDGCYLIDRNFNFRRVQMKFPTSQSVDGLHKKNHNFTLLDGEMVIDTEKNTGKQERRYLTCDLMAINNESVIDLPFHERWMKLEKEVVEPRNQERYSYSASASNYYRFDMEPFRVRRKEYWPLSTVSKLVDDFIPKLSHPSDGLIFQGWDDQFAPHNHGGLLKWQFRHMVNFLFEVDKQGQQFLFVLDRGQKRLAEGDKVVFGSPSDASKYSGKVIECCWVSDKKVWSFLSRCDKETPTEFRNYDKVSKSIKNFVVRDFLVIEVMKIARDRAQDNSSGKPKV
ncbi:mRNA guanylyltransferase [Ranunculus cassubicifolius]